MGSALLGLVHPVIKVFLFLWSFSICWCGGCRQVGESGPVPSQRGTRWLLRGRGDSLPKVVPVPEHPWEVQQEMGGFDSCVCSNCPRCLVSAVQSLMLIRR